MPEAASTQRQGTVVGILPATDLHSLFDALTSDGYRIVGPRMSGAAVTYEELSGVGELPRGVRDEQSPGEYRIRQTDSDRLFDFAVGPQSLKRYLYPPRRKLWEADRGEGGWTPSVPEDDYPRTAFVGVRACEIEAIRILDRVLLQSGFEDPVYAARRKNTLIVSIDCAKPASTCFCTSMDGDPGPTTGYDVNLAELGTGDEHRFLIEASSEAGAAIVAKLPCTPAVDRDTRERTAQLDASREAMGHLPEMGRAPETLRQSPKSGRWEEVADRCLSCANCTMACPTCFCVDVEDVTDLTGDHAERWQQWDSCFTLSHSYLHGGSVRKTTAARYRQWLTHKLSSWHDQFDTSGCVGCGRCIAWCPVGIDIREEVAAIDAEASAAAQAAEASGAADKPRRT